MFTYLWQCLAWLDPEVTQATVSPAIIMDNKKPSSVTQTGRRKSGGSTQLRSPVVKRPQMAPVSLQGWLHKQGSEGLMLWKKRWFVLSEYCLFYYKGPEEEKLLGSILLPSYKVSPCTAEDKVYRKFAFKAEHANMRTYYFAAETRELMTQWMNALSLATILQEGSKLQGHVQPSMLSMGNEDSDSGFQGYRPRPITTQPTSQDGNMNGWAPPRNPYQPLYANAPPKPRRLNNEGQYAGSSPEASPDRRDEMMYRRPGQQIATPNRGMEYHYHQRVPAGYPTLPNPDVVRSIPNTGTYPGGMAVERRTPDPFGRSNINTPSRGGDYSDVYKSDSYNGGVYQRPEGPANVGYVKTTNPPIVNYQHPNQYYQGYHQLPQMSSAPRYQGLDTSSSNVISRRDRQPPRPHSADFLDYDAKRYYQYQEYKETTIVEKTDVKIDEYPPARPPRPKSSMDVMHANDGYYWSEESYAEKMRQSAMYLQNTLPQRSQSSRSNTPNFNRTPKNDSVVMRQKTEGAKSPSRQNPRRWSEYNNDRNGNQFVRSASARLPKNRQNDDESDEVQAYTGGEDFKDERKEESMKRLLEWKQRMLQSPLTRKPSGSSTRGTSQNELSKYYKQQVLRELERQEAKSREELGKKRLKPDGLRLRSRSTDGRRSAMSSSNRYNSYSSDDEENDERRSRRSSTGGRPRKSNEESKNKKSTPDKVHYTSPDYENVAGGAADQFSYESKKSDDGSKPMDDTVSKHSDSGYDTLKQTDDISQQMSDLTKMKNFEVTNQPTLVYPVHNVKQNWNEKIDESKLIKEFSYQYIKDGGKVPEKNVDYKVLDSPPENIVKSRIKQLGLDGVEIEGKEVMKEPLKVAAPGYQTNEAHVSNLKNVESSELQERRNNKNLRSFALGDITQKSQESTVKEVPEKHQKSVKDLLADFERKSQLAHERQALEHEKNFEESPGKRYVFSDTETLLYDTSSDTDDKKQSPDPSILNSLRRPESRVEMTEEEDGDEEVAAALGRREKFFSSCRDLGRKRDPDYNFRGKKLKPCANVEPSPSSEVETIMTPGYIRSSLTESMVVHENSDSTCSTPIIEQIKDNLQKTLPKENLLKSEEEIAEGHYMPMTPSRRVSAPPSDKSRSNSSLHSVLFGVEMEETYVEMAEPNQNNLEPNKSFLSSVRKPFSPGYCELSTNNESHYDYLYRATTAREPEYMEVNSLLEVLKEQDKKIQEHKEEAKKLETGLVPPTPPRSALPDILNSSTTSQPKSDSSDADDESSKDLDSLDTPRHPRFSLSDTFRPASYYLGNTLNDSRNLIGLPNPNENHDSSDSDLVSPPPIPTSPPPLDDLDTSLETESSLEIRDAPKLKISDKDLSKKLWSKPLDESRKLKRRPVSEDILESLEESDQSFTQMKLPVNDLDSIGSRSGVALDEENGEINLDQYLEDLQLTDSKLMFNENIYKSYEKEFTKNLMPKESVSKADGNEKSLFNMEKRENFDEVQYENLQHLFPPPPPELYNPEDSIPMYRNVPIADVPPPENYCDVYSPPEPAKVRFDPDTLQQQNGEKNLENQGAPYYYSDIIKNEEEEFASSTSDRSISSIRGHLIQRYQPLNNQRENVHESNHCIKRNDIGRKVNPISQPSQQGGDLDDVQKITAELRTTSAHFMGAADKSGSVDVRNIYESDTLQRRKTETLPTEMIRVRTPDLHHPQGIARNLYPHGLRDKSSTPNIPFPNVIPQPARSRSLEGLLNESGSRLTEQTPPNILSNRLDPPNPPRKDQVSHSRLDSSEGDDLWEEDALWRENLRRVSIRHTRSLDNLDDEVTETNNVLNRSLPVSKDVTGRRSVDHFTSPRVNILPTGRRSVDHFISPPRGRLSRDVTYVNDMFWSNRQLNLAREYEQDYREGRVRPKKRDEIRTVVELSDSGILDCDDGIHYERLTRSTERRKRDEMYLESYEWDEDRETFRRNQPEKEQGNNGQRQQQSFLGDGTPQPPPPPLTHPQASGLEPIDREKLRQWDLMSSGTVEQEADTKKEKKATGEESNGKKLEEVSLEGKSSGDFSTAERHAAQTQQMQEASASGSVMREAHLPRSMSTLSQGQQFQQRSASHQVTTPTIVLSKEESPTEKKINAHEGSDRRLDEYSERIDYYDRGKGYPVAVNGYSDWNDSYADRKNEYVGGREYVDGYLDRRRAPENDYYIDQYQDHRIGGLHNRNCGTLPMAKSTSTVPVPSISLQGSSLGRNAGTYDGRYVKDSGKRARLAELETPKRMEHLQKLEELKKHLLDLEKQYEKGKPLVNLVDNMVKLGSLYRGNNHVYNGNVGVDHSANVREKLEFNQKVQEQRLLAEERRDWDRLSPDHNQLQAKVQQLYRLDRLLQEESGTLQSLQQDKELLEKALGGLRHKLQINRSNPVEADRYRKQQKLLEKELSRVRLLLAHNSKKLEETVTENARLEQELVILRQKLQASRVSSRSSVPLVTESATLSTTAALEAELRRVQQLVGDLQRQRQELSAQVKQLTEKSDTLVQQIRPGPTGVAGAGPIPGKKKSSATWLETDLDLLITQDVGLESPVTSPQHQPTTSVVISSRSTTPIYINTDISTSKKDTVSSIDEQKSPGDMTTVQTSPSTSAPASTMSGIEPIMTYTTPVELSEADDRMKRFYGIIPREKQEIKTVRIVKRESERRQRDRDRSGNIGLPTTAIAKRVSVIEEDDGMLGRVEEESYETYSPNFNDEYHHHHQHHHHQKTNGINDRSQDPYMNFHPTNPFLPQNLGNISHLEELTSSYESEPLTSQNQRSMSLPRGFGKSPAPVVTSRDSTSSLRNMIAKRNRVRFENQYQEGSGSESGPNSPRNESPNRNYSPSQGGFVSNRIYPKGYTPNQRPFSPSQTLSPSQMMRNLNLDPDRQYYRAQKQRSPDSSRPMSAREQLFGSNCYLSPEDEISPQLSPVYQSEAAREIIMEMSGNPVRKNSNRRQVPREKRRHHTVSNIRHITDSDSHFRMGSARSRDDLDMERALRPRMNAPDVVRSTMNHKDLKYNENTIDNILGTPNKIIIPERYIPEQEPILTAEEQLHRLKKAESIRKMLSETSAISTPDLSGEGTEEQEKSSTLKKKVEEEKKQREHLLELNQILAQQVMEKSKLVAGSISASSHQQD